MTARGPIPVPRRSFYSRTARIRTLIEQNAPRYVIACEAKLILRAWFEVESDWQLARKIFYGYFLDAFRNRRRDLRFWWLLKVRGMNEEQAIDQICSDEEPEERKAK